MSTLATSLLASAIFTVTLIIGCLILVGGSSYSLSASDQDVTGGEDSQKHSGQWKLKAATRKEATERPSAQTPPFTLTCTLGSETTHSVVIPEDGLCSYIFLDWLPVDEPSDLGYPFPPNVRRFLVNAANYKSTEFGVAFDSDSWVKMKQVVDDVSSKYHFQRLYNNRVTHFGYINTNTHLFNASIMTELLKILQRIKSLCEDSHPDRRVRTFLASAWRPQHDRVPAKDASSAFRTILMPDLFISKAHLGDVDSNYDDCRVLPSTFLRGPKMENSQYVYPVSLNAALIRVKELRKLLPGKKPALSVSVGLAGRWYSTRPDQRGAAKRYVLGQPCLPSKIVPPLASATKMCGSPDVRQSENFHSKFVLVKNNSMVFTFDTPDTFRYKLCASKKNMTTVNYGITAANIEFADARGHCGRGETFPVLRTLKRLVEFFEHRYVSEEDFKTCLILQ
ncbi:uncharacterized protein [Dermacentor albipictus]